LQGLGNPVEKTEMNKNYAGGIHQHQDTEDAYDATQCREDHRTGDTLLIEEEGIVGIVYTWPVAVTVEKGSLHGVKTLSGNLISDLGGIKAIRKAVNLAKSKGFPLAKEFADI
jgi:hypothetical protein